MDGDPTLELMLMQAVPPLHVASSSMLLDRRSD